MRHHTTHRLSDETRHARRVALEAEARYVEGKRIAQATWGMPR